jgi:glucose/arabinose dehydrogenase
MARLLQTSNSPLVVPLPPSFQPQVPSGFKVSVVARGLQYPRWLAVAPNGDVFVADSAAGEVVVLRLPPATAAAASVKTFAEHLNLPFGIAFHEDYVYIANTNEVLRFRYDPKSSKRLSEGEPVLQLPKGGYNRHWTRSLAFSPEGKKLFVSIGSETNVSVESDWRRATILMTDPDGKNTQLYASGLRNAAGIAFNGASRDLWATVNERDNLGDDIPSDFFTHVVPGGFYGWPYAYLGHNADKRVRFRPDLTMRAITPDELLGAHVAPLQFAFYEGREFPSAYWGGAFIAEHGSWNRHIRSGYQVIFVPFHNGFPAGPPRPFFSGLVPDAAGKEVYGRPVGVAVACDGSLLISDDGQKLIWRVYYEGSPQKD